MGKRYVGERVLQKCGEYAEIIKLLPKGRCKVRFDNGVEKICSRCVFASGDMTPYFQNKRFVGERVLQNCGEYAEIIELLPNRKCRVKFDSGGIKTCSRVSFIRGMVLSRQVDFGMRYVGERVLQKNGEYAEIIELLPKSKCKVRFDSGDIEVCARYAFVNGILPLNKLTKRYIGERVQQANGEYAEIIELLQDDKCSVRFDNGDIVIARRHIFARGRMKNRKSNYEVGMHVTQHCGAIAEYVDKISHLDIIVRFEDGTRRHCTTNHFVSRSVVPSVLRKSGRYYFYHLTGEKLMDMYFDKTLAHYVGVLRRSDGTRYVRVLD